MSKKGVPKSEEHKRTISETMKAAKRTASDEQKKAVREGQIRRWAKYWETHTPKLSPEKQAERTEKHREYLQRRKENENL